MSAEKGKALLMLLGKGKPDGGDDAEETDEGGENYDADLKAALGDLASALGVTVKSPERGIEAMKTIHDLCGRSG